MLPSPTPILHVDMDAFYASVEQRDRPELRGRPVIVGGPAASRGVVSAASYEARAFGVHSAMPTATARRLCPHGVFLPVRMKHYAQVARQIREILGSFTPLVEPLSLDEAFLDVRGCEGLFGPGPDIARQVKARVRAETGLVASVGVAANKFLAKLATDLGKPDGLVVIEPGRAAEVLSPLPVGRLWGVGARAEKRLHDLGVKTIGQLAALPERALVDHFGEAGRHLHRLARGLDDRAVVPDEQARSVSTETTFARDVGDREILRGWLLELAEHLGQRVRALGARARTVELKARTSDFRTYLRSVTLAEPTDLTEEIWRAAAGLFEGRVPDAWLPLRLLGVGVSGLTRDPAEQGHLFDQEWRARQRALDQALDAIRARFGTGAVRRGGGPGPKAPPGGKPPAKP
jgi:DNA polymerase IV